MAVELALHAAQLIDARAHQISLRIFQFVLVQFKLRLEQVELLLQGIFLVGLRGGEFFLIELNPRLVRS